VHKALNEKFPTPGFGGEDQFLASQKPRSYPDGFFYVKNIGYGERFGISGTYGIGS
jgi:hypothetical protein